MSGSDGNARGPGDDGAGTIDQRGTLSWSGAAPPATDGHRPPGADAVTGWAAPPGVAAAHRQPSWATPPPAWRQPTAGPTPWSAASQGASWSPQPPPWPAAAGWSTAGFAPPPRRGSATPWIVGGAVALLVLVVGVWAVVRSTSSAFDALTDVPPITGNLDAHTFGDDAALDALWTSCAEGSYGACDELYFRSPFGSEYEAFGDSCGRRNIPGGLCTEIYGPR